MFARMDGTAYARPRLSVVLPARDEEDNIVHAIETVFTRASSVVSELEVIVVDDGSRDRTAARVRAHAAVRPGIVLVSHPRGLGYGAALRSGFDAARFEWLFYSDSDGQFPLRELPVAIAAIGEFDAVVGVREDRADPLHRRWLGRTWTSLVRRATGLHARDVNCAFKLFPRSIASRGSLRSNGAAISAELLLAFARADLRVVELGVEHRTRTVGAQTGARASVAIQALTELASLVLRTRSTRAARASRRVETLDAV